MDLYLYEYNSSTNIDNVFSWKPEALQWWVTGFNPEYAGRVDVNKLVSVGCIYFTGHENMYNSLEIKYKSDDELKQYLIFNNENHLMWLMWNGRSRF